MKFSSIDFIGIILMSCITLCLQAQALSDSLLYEGSYQIGTFEGQATYCYQLEDQDTILQGAFQMEGADLPALLSGKGNYFSFEGDFQQNEPTGQWAFEFGDYTASRLTKVDTNQYQLAIDGMQQYATGILRAGKPDGVWIQKVQRMEASKPSELVFESKITFKRGIPQQSFRMESAKYVLLGRFKRDGLAHDVWTLYTNLAIAENWYFQEGRLDKIEIQQDDGVETLEIFNPSTATNTLIDLDARYFRLLAVWQQLAGLSDTISDGRVADLLTTNAHKYEKVSAVINEWSNADFRFMPKVRVPHFPLSSKEQKKLSKISDYLQKIDTIYQSLNHNTSLSILENTDQEVAYQMAVLGAINKRLLAPVRKLQTAQEEDILQFVDRNRYYNNLWSSDASPSILSITLNERENRDFPTKPFDVQAKGLAAVEEMTAYVFRQVDSIQIALNEKLNTKERRQVLTALEDQMMREFSLLDSLIESQSKKVRKTYGLHAVQAVAKQAKEDYMSITAVTSKQAQARELVQCLEELDALTITLIQLPQKLEKVEALYTDEIWNNFTATVMEDRVKKHLFNAYQAYLIPYFQAQVKTNLSCQNAQTLNNQIKSTYQRMLELRTAETSDLENQLKREDDPKKIMTLLQK